MNRALMIALMLLLFTWNAFGEETGEITLGKCYPASAFQLRIEKKIDAHTYGVFAGIMSSKYSAIGILTTKKVTFGSTGVVPKEVKRVGKDSVESDDGFGDTELTMWEVCE